MATATEEKPPVSEELHESQIRKPPVGVEQRIERGRKRMVELAPRRNECLRFWRGDQYVSRHTEGYLVKQGTLVGSEKPRHRVRLTHNLLTDVVAQEVSAATQRVPSYEVSPATTDPEDVSAGKLAEKIALFGYDAWNLREATVDAYTYAVVADEGFVWPYFDNQVGKPITNEVSTGEIRVRVFGPNEVYWEPGVPFEDSRWHVIEQGRPLEEVYNLPGYLGGKLNPDADTSDVLGDSQKTGKNLVLVTEYLERPSSRNKEGRRVTIANKRVICEEEPYPLYDGKSEPLDEPVLHKLSYFQDPDSDRDQGLVQHLLDDQRLYNDCLNRICEWKNLALLPQVLAPIGSLKQRLTDEPGAVFTYTPVSGQVPQWRPVPQIPGELFTLAEKAQSNIAAISAQNQVPAQVESGKGIQALIEKDQSRRQMQINALAEFHSRLMRHCLYLVQRHYSEPRLIKIRGSFGWESIKDFQGSTLRNQVDIRVLPGSIEPRTKADIERKVMTFAQMGWVKPEAAMAAINGGTAESLVEDYEKDVHYAHRLIQRIKAGPEALFTSPPRQEFDPQTQQMQEVPAWMPRRFHNIPVLKQVFESFMKTEEYEDLDAPMRSALDMVYEAVLKLEADKQAEEIAAQNAQAEGQGMMNAAKDQGTQPKPMPSLPMQQGQAPLGQQTSPN